MRSVTDGDTLVLGNGDSVRLVRVDAPESGACGSERAAQLLTRLTLGEQVTLTAPVDDRDRYGRLLRYVDIGATDTGSLSRAPTRTDWTPTATVSPVAATEVRPD